MLKVRPSTKSIVVVLSFLLISVLEAGAQDFNNYFKSFSAKHQAERGVLLSWDTKYNDTTAYFIVERSVDGQNFEELDKVAVTNTKTFYKFIDYEPYVEVSYYRIKGVDYDGRIFTSSLTSVFIAGSGKPELVLYPMPIGNTNSLSLNFKGIEKEFKAIVTITDQFGRQVLNKEMSISSIDSMGELDLEGKLSTGFYHLTVWGHSGQRFKIGKLLQFVD